MMDTATHASNLPQTPQPTSSVAMIGTLTGIALVSGLLLALVYQGTYDRIQHNRQARTRAAVEEILPGIVSQRAFEAETSLDDGVVTQQIYAGYDASGALVGVAIEASDSGGYGGEIRIIYGYLPDKQEITGMKVLLSKETPGLGDRITTDPAFRANFDGLQVPLDPESKEPVTPIVYAKPGAGGSAGEVEGISGATISSQAVTRAVRESTARVLPIVYDMLDELKKGGQ